MEPIFGQRVGWVAKEAADVGGVLPAGVEVDKVRNRKRQVQRLSCNRDGRRRPTGGQSLLNAGTDGKGGLSIAGKEFV